MGNVIGMVVVVVACWAGMVSLATLYCVYWCHFIEGRQASHVAGGREGRNLVQWGEGKAFSKEKKKITAGGETENKQREGHTR